jgi:hypothetical protein
MTDYNPLESITFTVAEIIDAHEQLEVFNRSCNQSIYNLADFILLPRRVTYENGAPVSVQLLKEMI